MRFFDSHCHFDFPEFDPDRMQVWQGLGSLGVAGLLVPGVAPSQWPGAQALSHQLSGCYFALGIHPWWIDQIATDTAALDTYARQIHTIITKENTSDQSRCLAIGEAGLDKTIGTPLEQQLALLGWHIDLANDLDLPLIVHSVRTHNELISHCKRHRPVRGGVVHAFNGSYETAMQLIDLGFYLGAGGAISYPHANKTRTAFTRVPLGAVLIESDAPDMPLHGRQGQRNSPEHIPTIARILAELRGEDPEVLAAQLWQNHCHLFGDLR